MLSNDKDDDDDDGDDNDDDDDIKIDHVDQTNITIKPDSQNFIKDS